MARISKDPEERRLELISTAERLFNEKGFENTSVSDIVKSIGVAQGTFYYYFKSKDDIFNAIAERFFNEFMENFALIVDNENLNTREKIELILDEGIKLLKDNEGVMFYLHTKDNIELHEKVERKLIEHATPLAMKIVKQGVEEKLFDIQYPEDVITFLMMGSHFLSDVNIYLEKREIYFRRLQAVMFVVQRVLGIDSVRMEHFTGRFMTEFMKVLP